jgi:hypothetical protein
VTNNILEVQSTSSFTPVETEPRARVGFYEPFVDEHAVARHLVITPRRVLEMARKDQIPAHPLGHTRKTWRFRMSEIDAHFSARPEKRPSATIALAVSGTQERKRLG